MVKSSTAFAVLLGVCVLAGPVRAAPPAPDKPTPGQADLGTLLDTVRANRKALVSVNLQLSTDEAAKFWPLYDRYQQQMNAVGDRMAAMIEEYKANYRTLSNDKALQLVDDYLAAEADRVKVRRDFVGEFAKILPGRTVARFYQLENKLDAVVRYGVAATIPVLEESDAGQPR